MQVSVSESRLLRTQRGLLPSEGAISVSEGGLLDGVRINFEEGWLLRQADNMGQQLQRQLDPVVTSVPLENNC